MIVADASAVLESLLRLPSASRIDAQLFAPGQTLHAPHLVDVEIAQVLRRFVLAGTIDAKRGQEAVSDMAVFPVRRHAHDILLPRIWALRANFSAYDAAYVALAEALGATLVTCDKRLAAAAAVHVKIAPI